MEDYLRMTANLPERDFDTTYMAPKKTPDTDEDTKNPEQPPPAAGEDEPDAEGEE